MASKLLTARPEPAVISLTCNVITNPLSLPKTCSKTSFNALSSTSSPSALALCSILSTIAFFSLFSFSPLALSNASCASFISSLFLILSSISKMVSGNNPIEINASRTSEALLFFKTSEALVACTLNPRSNDSTVTKARFSVASLTLGIAFLSLISKLTPMLGPNVPSSRDKCAAKFKML